MERSFLIHVHTLPPEMQLVYYKSKEKWYMVSQPSKKKMNKGRNMPAVLKHYILLLMFQVLRPVIHHLVQSRGQNTGISHSCFKQRICHGDWISIWSAPSESSSYLIVMSRIFLNGQYFGYHVHHWTVVTEKNMKKSQWHRTEKTMD